MKRLLIGCCLVLALAVAGSARADKIHEAATKGELAIVKALVKANPAAVSTKDEDGAAPLHWAAAKGQKAVTEFLIISKADVNARKKDGVTPLHVASALGHRDVAELLLKNKADVNAADNQGRTALSLAEGKGHKSLVKLLLAHNAVGAKPPMQFPQPVEGPPPGKEFESGDIMRKARSLIEAVSKGDTASAAKDFDANLKSVLTPSKLREAWAQVAGVAGPFKKLADARVENVKGYDTVFIACEFEKAVFTARIVFNKQKEISGLWFDPGQHAPKTQ